MKDHDSAIAFTLAYLKLLELHLKVTWSDAGIPHCVTDWITDESITHLRADLAKLMTGDLERAARQATAAYGLGHIQTVGFGLAPDFDQFVKLGLIYGERVVLWDMLYSRVLAGGSYLRRKGLIAQIACELLMLKAVVEQGGVVLLAHPIVWSPVAAQIDVELRANGSAPAASLGLSMAFAAIQEDLQLHPYTLLSDSSRSELAQTVKAADHELFSRENFRFQQCLTSLLRDERVAFVEDVPTEDFYLVLSEHEMLRQKLRRHFSPALAGLSPQQMILENKILLDELFDLFGKRDTALHNYVADAVDATSVLITASVSATVIGQPLLTALAAIGVPAMALSTAVRKWAGKPEKNVIIQAFQALKKSVAKNQAYDPVDIQNRIATVKAGLESLNDHYREFMSYHWTEHRQDYLESLPLEIAKEVLALLSPDDIEEIVNTRHRQQDYIGDYLAYISDLDEAIHWAHLEKSFNSPDGFLIYDGDAHIEAMQSLQIPMSLWQRLLDSLFTTYSSQMRTADYDYPLMCFPEIVHFQTTHANDMDEKRSAVVALVDMLTAVDQDALMTFLSKGFNGVSPEWLGTASTAGSSRTASKSEGEIETMCGVSVTAVLAQRSGGN
ncbi:hypothetical protein PS874_05185 [Pseudomonas fluorescens]|nr:hypothetical protein PS874_05185 [Pseudomonas fluorescens]